MRHQSDTLNKQNRNVYCTVSFVRTGSEMESGIFKIFLYNVGTNICFYVKKVCLQRFYGFTDIEYFASVSGGQAKSEKGFSA